MCQVYYCPKQRMKLAAARKVGKKLCASPACGRLNSAGLRPCV